MTNVQIKFRKSDHWGIAIYDWGKGARYFYLWQRPDLTELGRTGDRIDVEQFISESDAEGCRVIECTMPDATRLSTRFKEFFGDLLGEMECSIGTTEQ